MIARRLEYGREIERRDAEIGQVVKTFDDADQVAALDSRGKWVQHPTRAGWRACVPAAVREPVGENLIKDRVSDPLGGLWCARIHGRILESGNRMGE